MNLCFLINPSHQWQFSLSQALALAGAVREQGHQLHSVFFYGEALNMMAHKALTQPWLELHQQLGTRLLLCRTMMEHFDLPAPAAKAFEVVGMASLTSIMEQTDRTVELA
jgi:sulfur relay (sulfurtransferase) complex TusBCD TusD component (DsrE family)